MQRITEKLFIWWLFSGGYWLARSDAAKFLGISLFTYGLTLFFLAVLFALWFRARQRTSAGAWLTAAFLAFAFFMLPTEMHERYLYPFFALFLPIIPLLRPARWLFGFLALMFTWNLIVALVILKSHGTSLEHFGGGSNVVAVVNIILFVLTVVWYARMARHRPQRA